MTRTLTRRIESIRELQLQGSLTHMQRGLEKESLRIASDGLIAQTPHPAALGSALTHPSITTDYSEALMEFITPVYDSPEAALNYLDKVHRFTYQHLNNETLWVNSMPCIMSTELGIPIAEYGTSNVGQMKHVYRHGLWHRYGRYMQTIAGLHYNISLPDAFWSTYQSIEQSPLPQQDFISEQYFGLIRNFQRNVGLLVYLFGASPAVCGSFLQGKSHPLLKTWQDHTRYLPYGTSLRMSDLGYQNDAQASLNVSYNSLPEYVTSLQHAIRTPHPPYEKIGVRKNGIYQQLNTNILQIENEFYSSIRPKRVAASGERPTCALASRGVEYIELRCIDLDPFTPGGISEEQIRVLDVFTLYCLLQDSPSVEEPEHQRNLINLQAIVTEGRNPDLQLATASSQIPFSDWAQEHLTQMQNIAQLLDQAHQNTLHSKAVKAQFSKVKHPESTPSGRILNQLFEKKQSFFEFAMDCAEQQAAFYQNTPLSEADLTEFTQTAQQSLEDQSAIEASDTVSFERYLDAYFKPDACLINIVD